jgi:hypothetical protein
MNRQLRSRPAAFYLFQKTRNLKMEIPIYMQLRLLGQLGKPHCGIDVVTQELLP